MAQVLHVTTCDVTIFKRARQLCGLTGFLPTSYIIPEEFIQMAEYPITLDIFGDVWEGIYNDNRVTIKTFRLYKESDLRKVRKVTHPVFQVILGTSFDSRNQRFCKEVVIWRRISHPNIVAFLGVSKTQKPVDCNWCVRLKVRELKLMQTQLLGISRGSTFLHSFEIVYGDLKGARLSFFLCYILVGSSLTISHLRTIFLLTSLAVRVLLTLGSPP